MRPCFPDTTLARRPLLPQPRMQNQRMQMKPRDQGPYNPEVLRATRFQPPPHSHADIRLRPWQQPNQDMSIRMRPMLSLSTASDPGIRPHFHPLVNSGLPRLRMDPRITMQPSLMQHTRMEVRTRPFSPADPNSKFHRPRSVPLQNSVPMPVPPPFQASRCSEPRQIIRPMFRQISIPGQNHFRQSAKCADKVKPPIKTNTTTYSCDIQSCSTKKPRVEKLLNSIGSQDDVIQHKSNDVVENKALKSLGLPTSFSTTKIIWGNNKAKKDSKDFIQNEILNELTSSQLPDIPTPAEAPDQSLFCRVCNLFCNSLETFNNHMVGKKHMKNVEKFTELDGMNCYRPYYCEICQQDCRSRGNFNVHINGIKHKRKHQQLKFAKLKEKRHPSVYCHYCDIYLDPQLMPSHKEGRAHKIARGRSLYKPQRKRRKRDCDAQPGESQFNNISFNITSEDIYKNDKLDELMRLTDCCICGIEFGNDDEAMEHYQSGQHIEKMKEYQATIEYSTDSDSDTVK